MSRVVFAFLAALLASPVHSATYCPDKDQFCVVSTSPSCYTIHSALPGWAAFGVGSGMKDADIYMAWPNSKGDGVTFSNQVGGDHVKPTLAPVQNAKIVALADPKPVWSKLSFSFCKIDPGKPAPITATTSFVYAYSKTPVNGNADSTAANYGQHDDGCFGMIDAKSLAGGSTSSSSSTASSLPTSASASSSVQTQAAALQPAEGSKGVDEKGSYVIKYVPCEDQPKYGGPAPVPAPLTSGYTPAAAAQAPSTGGSTPAPPATASNPGTSAPAPAYSAASADSAPGGGGSTPSSSPILSSARSTVQSALLHAGAALFSAALYI